jgi:CO/xanthine dehydrogenase FAD-binding subunit
MSIARPRDLPDALTVLAMEPDALLLAGGTDLMVQVNAGRLEPRAIVSLRRVAELKGWERVNGYLFLGAGMSYAAMQDELSVAAPSLAVAARTVGSPQIRNAGTLGGNLGTASPAGDTLPPLAALDAEVVIASRAGDRGVPIGDFIVGVKRTVLSADEIIRGVRIPAASGPQVFLKVGTRNAMVISVASCALVLDKLSRTVRCALGSVAPIPMRTLEAERLASAEVDWERATVSEDVAARFGALAAKAASPIDDHRSTAAYRRRAIEVIARRALVRATRQLQSEPRR